MKKILLLWKISSKKLLKENQEMPLYKSKSMNKKRMWLQSLCRKKPVLVLIEIILEHFWKYGSIHITIDYNFFRRGQLILIFEKTLEQLNGVRITSS